MIQRSSPRQRTLQGVFGLVGVMVLPGLASCVADEERATTPLVILLDREAWVESTADEDPFSDHRPAEVGCPAAAWIAERQALELSTLYCEYISIVQPSLVDLAAGDSLRLEAFHFDLTAPEPATGHWAIVVGDEVVWEIETSIPGPARFFEEELTVTKSHPAGTPVTVHLHNHGQNSYGLAVLDRI